MQCPIFFGAVTVSVTSLMCATAAGSSRSAARAATPTAADVTVLQRVLVQGGTVETYFGMVEGASYVIVAALPAENVDWRAVRDTGLATGGDTNEAVRSALRNLEVRNEQPWSIPPLDWGSHLRPATEDPMTAYKRDGTWADAYPGAVGVILVAAPGFAANGRSAIVYWTRTRAVERGRLLYGDSVLTYLERSGGRWHIRWEVVVHAA